MDLDRIDLSDFNAMDYHIWFAHTDKVPGLKEINASDQAQDYRKVYAGLLTYWNDSKKMLIDWMDGRLTDISTTASNRILSAEILRAGDQYPGLTILNWTGNG